MYNQNPEQKARDLIDEMLQKTGWIVQSKGKMNLSVGKGIAVREYFTEIGPADYLRFTDRKSCGIISDRKT